MLNKITLAAAIIALNVSAEQEMDVAPDARELADAWIAEHPDSTEGRRNLNDEFVAEDLAEEGRELHIASYAHSHWPWPYPFYRMAYCRMRYCSDYPTTYPYGVFWLHEWGPWSPLHIRGWMRNMPPPNTRHGFLINTNPFDGQTCPSTEPTWNPYGMPQGNMNTWPSRAGDLSPMTDFSGNSTWYGAAWQPTLYGWYTVANRSMCVYERYGATEAFYGNKIACCNIRRLWVIRSFDDLAQWQKTRADEPDVEIMTAEEYEKAFGEKFDPSKFEPHEIEPVDPNEPQEPIEPTKPDEPTRPDKPEEPEKPCSALDRRRGKCP